MNINKDHLAYLLNAYTNNAITDEELEELSGYVLEADVDPVLNELMQDFMDNMKRDPNLVVRKKELYENITAHPLFKAQLSPNAKVLDLQNWRKVFAYAAAILLIAGSAVFFYKQQRQSTKNNNMAFVKKDNLQGEPVKYILPDGSEVYLGAGSSIGYPESFAADTREIDLKGEAFFQVKHDAEKAFIIHTGEINTQVLGTSFKVSAFANQPVVVAVATGKVGVIKTIGEEKTTLALLTPGLSLTYNTVTKNAVQHNIEVYSLLQWKAGELVFEDQTIAEIAVELKRRYGMKIEVVDQEIANNQVSGTFQAGKSAQQIMKILAIAGKFKFKTINPQSFKIYKNQ
ncbi:FecR domain-containing protein [Pedobacter sp. MC2016-14]|uniref:FecR family protein n=1 Tax=Pedobacter sp. MC2016-14 TaxID=2897327 RepID=UPI001E4A3A05|nr:FecR domain-containing protein [Pedobacter sp. MC2016-14]MCD0488192.1 FecR domain-containing protein [Pedobacter sp. MC2016-14]